MAERPSLVGSAPAGGSAVPEPSPAARELLRAFREHESPSAVDRDRGFAALRARLETGADAPPAAANGRFYGIAKATFVTVAVAAAVLLAIKAVGSGVTALADRARQPAVEAPYQGEAGADGGQAVARAPKLLLRGDRGDVPAGETEQAAVIDAVARAADAAPAAPLQVAPHEEADAASSSARSSRPRVSTSTVSAVSSSNADDAIEEELALIRRATDAKKAGHVADGLAALREHARRFPKGVLADQRMVLKAELYCSAGRVREADALVEAFLRERPGSDLAGRMRNVCRK